MNRRILIVLIATVTTLSFGAITSANAEYDSSGAGTMYPERFGYQGYSNGGYDSYGYATRGTRVTTDSQYLGSRAHRSSQGWCRDAYGNRYACR